MKPRGIPIAQIDSNLEADPKFMCLRLKYVGGPRYYTILGTYLSLVLRVWATGQRESDPSLIGLMDPEILDDLRDVGLLDSNYSVPEVIYEKWTGEVLRQYQARSDQLASIASIGGRARASRAARGDDGRLLPADDPAVTAGDPAVTARGPAVIQRAQSPLPTLPTLYEENGTNPPAREGWEKLGPLVAELAGVPYPSPDSKLSMSLLEDVRDFGMPRVEDAARAVSLAMRGTADLRALAFGVRNVLRPPPDAKVIAAAESEAAEKRSFERRVERTKRQIEQLKGGS